MTEEEPIFSLLAETYLPQYAAQRGRWEAIDHR